MDSIDSLVLLSIETKDKFTRLRELSNNVFQRNTADECFDIARKLFLNNELVKIEISNWNLSNSRIKETCKFASKHLNSK
jgi:hypothetical protein